MQTITLDKKDKQILSDRIAAWNKRRGPRVGDYVKMLDGTTRRFTHHWGDGLQVTCAHNADTSFYLGDGYMSFSGSLDPCIPLENIKDTGKKRNGWAWFFHHDSRCAHNGVQVEAPCRVYAEGSA